MGCSTKLDLQDLYSTLVYHCMIDQTMLPVVDRCCDVTNEQDIKQCRDKAVADMQIAVPYRWLFISGIVC